MKNMKHKVINLGENRHSPIFIVVFSENNLSDEEYKILAEEKRAKLSRISRYEFRKIFASGVYRYIDGYEAYSEEEWDILANHFTKLEMDSISIDCEVPKEPYLVLIKPNGSECVIENEAHLAYICSQIKDKGLDGFVVKYGVKEYAINSDGNLDPNFRTAYISNIVKFGLK